MKEIRYTTKKESGSIYWAASEDFGELVGTSFSLGQMNAFQIEKMNNLTLTAKILLSAVAGAVIQRLIDGGEDIDTILTGTFFVKKEVASEGK